MDLPPCLEQIRPTCITQQYEVVTVCGGCQNIANQLIALICLDALWKRRRFEHLHEIAISLHMRPGSFCELESRDVVEIR